MSTIYLCNDPSLALKAINPGKNDLDCLILETTELNLGIEEVRNLKNWLAIKPLGKIKTAVITQAQRLTTEAQNAILKTLEEPPENTQIFLVVPDLDALLPTVVSRCQIIPLASPFLQLPKKDQEEATKILRLMAENTIPAGFVWAKSIPDRKTALAEIDKLLIAAHQDLMLAVARKLLYAKRYLLANCNVRLTLENLFL